jgi:LuxR family maltose regulon positive regulatory protein
MPSAARPTSYRFDSAAGACGSGPAVFRRQFDGLIAAHEPARAATLLDAHCEELFAESEAQVFAACVRQIPRPVRDTHPRTMLALAWRLTAEWRFEQAADLLAAVRTRIARMRRGRAQGAATELQLLLRHREAMLAQVRDDMPVAELRCRELVEDFRGASHYVRGSLFTGLLHASREQYKLGEMDRYDALARDCIQQSANDHALAVHESVAGATLFMAGRCDAAISALRAGLDLVVRLGGEGHPLGALTALPLAEVLYEQNAIEEAAALIAVYLPVANEMGFVDQLVSGYITAARLCRRRGDLDGALAVLDRASTAGARRGFSRLQAWASAERVSVLSSRTHALGQARHEVGARVNPLRLMAGPNVTTLQEARALAWVRLARAQCRTSDALGVARSWRAAASRSGAVRSLVRWEVMLATLLLLDGQKRGAVRALARAATAAAPGRFFASFADEGSLIERLLAEQPDGFAVFGETTRAFVARLMPMFRRSETRLLLGGATDSLPVCTSALNAKEIEVLALAAKGWRNQDVGARLGMSEATVKWYLHQCYEKLGVSKRAFAADKARRFGLID